MTDYKEIRFHIHAGFEKQRRNNDYLLIKIFEQQDYLLMLELQSMKLQQ